MESVSSSYAEISMPTNFNAIDNSSDIIEYQFDNERARAEILDFIILSELPLTFVETHDFAGMIQRGFEPQFQKISRKMCESDVAQRFEVCKHELVAYFDTFKGKVCLAFDIWTSERNMNYMSLTAHWIDDGWCMQKRILSFKMIEYPHTEESLADHVYEELVAWHLHDKVFSITLHNVSSNDVLVAELGRHLMLDNVGKQVLHVRCACHILNLIVQDALTCLSPSIERITDIVRSMNSSIKRHELWVDCCCELGLGKVVIDNDVPHRWDSTFELLTAAVKYKNALHQYCLEVNGSQNCSLAVPSERDWIVASLCINLLSIFSASTKMCRGVYSPSSNRVINCLVDIYDTFKTYEPLDVFKPALDVMKLKFDEYWADFPIVFCLATILDPRFKLLAIKTWLGVYELSDIEIDMKVNNVKSMLLHIYDMYKERAAAARASSVAESVSMACLKRARVARGGARSDLQIYLDMDTLEFDDTANFDPLDWWKTNSSMYPVLSLMARDILSIPASTVGSGTAFSAESRVISEYRASHSPSTLEALVCLKDWMLAKSRSQD